MKTIFILLCSALFIPALFSQTFNPDIHHYYQNRIEKESGRIDFFSDQFTEDLIIPRSGPGDEILDSLYQWTWDSNIGDWKLFYGTLYTSNSNGSLEKELSYLWSETPRKIANLYSYSYDENNKRTQILYQLWNGSGWINSSQFLLTYSDNNQHSELMYQRWEGNEWINKSISLYTYDVNHNILNAIHKSWQSDQWVNESQSFYTYDENNLEVLYVSQVWSNGWQNKTQNIYFYNDENKLTESINKSWMVDEWDINYRSLYAYDTEYNLVHVLKQRPTGKLGWVDFKQSFYTYDSNHHMTSLLSQAFTNDVWVNELHVLETYNENQNQLTQVFQLWEDEWVNQDSLQYYYTSTTASKDLIEDQSGISIFPNPATNNLNLEFDEKFTGDIILEIYSANGVLQMKSDINPLTNKSIDINGLTPGEFHLVIRTTKGISFKNFIKL